MREHFQLKIVNALSYPGIISNDDGLTRQDGRPNKEAKK